MTRHILKSSAADNTIPQRDGPQLVGGEQFAIVHFGFQIYDL
jgi:hypothetical protein